MSILKVARLGHPALRGGARPLTAKDIVSARIQRLIADMVETMHEYNGVGLAAVQVHEPLQIAVLEVADNPRYPEKPAVPLSVLVNPRIEPLAQDMEEDWEGCLSVPDMRGRVPRYTELRVRALNHEGRELDFVASGFHARVIQHEFDHLNGKVYLDRMPDLSTLAHLQEYIRYWAEK
ncbi:MAG TPA: peptide deformylase [Candidatus Binatia bacterium]|jgi:peptide deformylase